MKQNKLQVYALIAEIVSAIAIMVSLLFVAYQLNQSNTVTNRDVDFLLFERGRELNKLVIESPEMASILIRGTRSPETLSAEDSLRYLAFYNDHLNAWEISWEYHASGILDDIAFQGWDDWFAAETRKLPEFVWALNRHHFPGDSFREHVDEQLGFVPTP